MYYVFRTDSLLGGPVEWQPPAWAQILLKKMSEMGVDQMQDRVNPIMNMFHQLLASAMMEPHLRADMLLDRLEGELTKLGDEMIFTVIGPPLEQSVG